MSRGLIEILPAESQIDQLKNELVNVKNELAKIKNELTQARCEANYYKSLHQRNILIRERVQFEHDTEILNLKQKHKEEIEALLYQVEELKAKLKLRERQLFGKKSEKGKFNNESQKKSKSKRKRGQQKKKKGPSRRKHPHLPVTDVFKEIPLQECLCPNCNAPYAEIESTEDSDILEINVKAYVRRIRRKKYRRTCNCSIIPIIITAPQAPKILPKSILGNSIWVEFLMKKFWHGLPLNRVIQELSSYGLNISVGTVIGGFSRLLVILKSVSDKIEEKSLSDGHWNADETGWKVFELIEGKVNYQWFLWVFKSESAVVYVLDPSRSARVVEEYFGEGSKGIISCDRYRAYFCFVSKCSKRFLIAFCWAHVRRDFLGLAKDRKEHELWAMDWVEEISLLYHINNCRIEYWCDPQAVIEEQCDPQKCIEAKQNHRKFIECDKELRQTLKAFKKKVDGQLKEENLAEPCRKVLESLNRHWHGLITFVKHPQVPMDNNCAERSLRGAVVGRKNYYGSGSIRSAQFSAVMFTIIQTLLIWGINPQAWFTEFFEFTAINPESPIDAWLPWNMNAEKLKALALNRHHDPP